MKKRKIVLDSDGHNAKEGVGMTIQKTGGVTKQQAEAAVRQHGSYRAAERATGISRKVLTRLLGGMSPGSASIATTRPKIGRALEEFRHTYDKATIIPAKIRTALNALANGWEYEVNFAKAAQVSLSDLGAFRDQFAAHVVTLREGRRAWAGKTATATKMREML